MVDNHGFKWELDADGQKVKEDIRMAAKKKTTKTTKATSSTSIRMYMLCSVFNVVFEVEALEVDGSTIYTIPL